MPAGGSFDGGSLRVNWRSVCTEGDARHICLSTAMFGPRAARPVIPSRDATKMVKSLHSVLSRRERIMDILFRLGRATAAEVMEELPGNTSYSTVRTQLRCSKRRTRAPRRRRPSLRLRGRGAAPRRAKSALRHLVETFFDGSAEKTVAAARRRRVAADRRELERIAHLIAKTRKDAGRIEMKASVIIARRACRHAGASQALGCRSALDSLGGDRVRGGDAGARADRAVVAHRVRIVTGPAAAARRAARRRVVAIAAAAAGNRFVDPIGATEIGTEAPLSVTSVMTAVWIAGFTVSIGVLKIGLGRLTWPPRNRAGSRPVRGRDRGRDLTPLRIGGRSACCRAIIRRCS
jgi:predicted transcriptional regulator